MNFRQLKGVLTLLNISTSQETNIVRPHIFSPAKLGVTQVICRGLISLTKIYIILNLIEFDTTRVIDRLWQKGFLTQHKIPSIIGRVYKGG